MSALTLIRRCSRCCPKVLHKATTSHRSYSLANVVNEFADVPRRSYLYVPSSSDRMLNKSLTTNADTIIYDLEDSVEPESKIKARSSLVDFLKSTSSLPPSFKISVRINDITSVHFKDDVLALSSLPPGLVSTIVVPKVEDISPLQIIGENTISTAKWNVIASIESSSSLWNLRPIASYKGDRVVLVALLFAAEDYCASTSILRSDSREELLYARSTIVTAAKAHGLQAIDMVNINYQNEAYHQEECKDGRRLGFDGKQAIHPSQVSGINQAFRPSNEEIFRAARILHQMEASHEAGVGAFGLTLDNRKEMIDAPMVKQAQKILKLARMCEDA